MKIELIVVMLSWITLVSSMLLMPGGTLSSTTRSRSASASMLKIEDIFDGSFSPREVVTDPYKTFDVLFSICPTRDAPNTIIRLIMPPDVIKLVNGNSTWTGEVKKGETVVLSLSFATNGDVDTHVKSSVEASETDKKYQSSYHLHVATPNAKFDPEKGIPAREVTPDAKMQVEVNIDPQRVTAPLEPGSSSTGSFRIYGRWRYWNDEIGDWSGGRCMLVEIWDADPGLDQKIASGWTDGEGYFDITAPNDDWFGTADPYIRFYAKGQWDWYTTDGSDDQYWWRYPGSGTIQDDVPDGWVYDTGWRGAGDYYQACLAGDAVFAEMQFMRDWVAWDRSRVKIQWPKEDWPHSHGDEIHLPEAGWNHVTAQHEQGHCVMWALYGGHWPPGDGPTTEGHYLASESSYGFALFEGWAEFMEAAVDNNPGNVASFGFNIETNAWFSGPFLTPEEGWIGDSGDMDGAIIEGSIASILWDIFDGTSVTERDYLYTTWNGGFDKIFSILMNDQPDDIFEFWNAWAAAYPDLNNYVGPLCNIYWNYGIDMDEYVPWGSITIDGGATFTGTRGIWLFVEADDFGSGVYAVRYADDYPTLTWSDWQIWASGNVFFTIDDPGDGWKNIHMQLMDNDGHISGAGEIYSSICLDTEDPTGSIVINSDAAYTKSRQVTLTLLGYDTGSGVDVMRFAEDYPTLTWSDWYIYWEGMPWTFDIASPNDGLKSIYVQFKDLFGRLSDPDGIYDTIILDTAAPTGSIIINSGDPAYTREPGVTLYLLYSDSLSGVKEVYYVNVGDPYSEGPLSPTTTKAWMLPTFWIDGTKEVLYVIYDYAGNYVTYSDSIILDTVAPAVTSFTVTPVVFSPNGDGIEDTTTVVATFSEMVDWEMKLDIGTGGLYWSGTGTSLNIVWDGKVGNTVVADGAYYFVVRGEDLAGWFSSPETKPVWVDTVFELNLESRQDTGDSANLGTITFDGVPYSLSSTIIKVAGGYQIQYSPASSCSFVNWEIAGGLSVSNAYSNPATVTVWSNGTLRAVYSWRVLTITASAESGGTISPSGAVPVTYGEDQAFTITADPGFEILDVVVDGTDHHGPIYIYTFSAVSSDHSIIAFFGINNHDVAVIDVTPARTIAGKGYPLLISVTVENQGARAESFNVTVYYGNSAITVEQWETFWSLGDVNRDGYINMIDMNLVGAAMFTTPSSPSWNPWADLNKDLKVDVSDSSTCGLHYGLEIWTYAISGGVIETQTVIDLAAGNTQTLTFTWDTSGMPYGNYVICSYAVPILGTGPPLGKEMDRADNTFTSGTLLLTIPGDVNGDRSVNVFDILNIKYCRSGPPQGPGGYDPNVDINADGVIDIFDILIAKTHHGQSW